MKNITYTVTNMIVVSPLTKASSHLSIDPEHDYAFLLIGTKLAFNSCFPPHFKKVWVHEWRGQAVHAILYLFKVGCIKRPTSFSDSSRSGYPIPPHLSTLNELQLCTALY